MFFLDPLVDLKKKGYAQISDCYVHIWCICYCFCIAGHSLGALVYLKTKLSNLSLSQLLMTISWRPFSILHVRPNDVKNVLMCVIIFLDTETHALVKKSSRPIDLSQILGKI